MLVFIAIPGAASQRHITNRAGARPARWRAGRVTAAGTDNGNISRGDSLARL